MNLFDLTFMAMGGIIGAGIFSSVGEGIGVTGRSITLALIVFVEVVARAIPKSVTFTFPSLEIIIFWGLMSL